MVSLNNYTGNQKLRHCSLPGFTLFEVLVVVAIISSVLTFGLFFSIDEYRFAAVSVERQTLVALLETARTRALFNTAALPHGVAFDPPGCPGYSEFLGATYEDSDPDTRTCTAALVKRTFSSSTPMYIVFTQLSGTTTPTDIVFVDATTGVSTTVAINAEGLIE